MRSLLGECGKAHLRLQRWYRPKPFASTRARKKLMAIATPFARYQLLSFMPKTANRHLLSEDALKSRKSTEKACKAMLEGPLLVCLPEVDERCASLPER